MKKLFPILAFLMMLVLPMHGVFADDMPAATVEYPAEYAAEFEAASAALQTHSPGAAVDYAVRERDDGRWEWDLFFTLDGKLGEAEINEADYAVRRVRLYDMPEGGLTALQAVEVLRQQKGDVQITDLELDPDDGRLCYEGEAVLNGKRYEFTISVTGNILEWEHD